MRPTRRPVIAIAALAVASCAQDRPAQIVASAKVPAYIEPAAEMPRILFDDGQVSVNDQCPVRKAKLNLRMPPVYVNGRPIGFC